MHSREKKSRQSRGMFNTHESRTWYGSISQRVASFPSSLLPRSPYEVHAPTTRRPPNPSSPSNGPTHCPPLLPIKLGVRVSVVLTLHGTLPSYAISLFSTDPFVSATRRPFDPPGCQPTTSQLTCIRRCAFLTMPSRFLGYNDGLQHPCLPGPSPIDRIRA